MTYVTLDLETEEVSLMPTGRIHALFLRYDDDDAYDCIEWGDAAVATLQRLLTEDVTFVIHNAAFDVAVLRAHGVDIPVGRYVDTMVALHCVNPQRRRYSLESWGEEAGVGAKIDYLAALERAGMWYRNGKDDTSGYNLPFNELMRDYGNQDTLLTQSLWAYCQRHFASDERLRKSYYEVHLPAVELTMSMAGGMHIDMTGVVHVATGLIEAVEDAEIAFRESYPVCAKMRWDDTAKEYVWRVPTVTAPPNLQSPNDVVSLLMTYGWKPDDFKRESGRPVTSQATLRRLIATPETKPALRNVASAIVELRSLLGIKSQVTQIAKLMDFDTGLLKGSWKQTGTVTFRYSSASPNCQNLSTRHPVWGKRIRGLFTPPPGYAMLSGDLSQIELGILAWYLEVCCDDSDMAAANRAGIDAHDANTSNWYGIRKEDDPVEFKRQRAKAKNGAFAAGYGAKCRRLALTLNISLVEAKEILDTVETATEIVRLKEYVWAMGRSYRDVEPLDGKRYGFIYDCFDTRVWYPDVASADKGRRASAERQMFNALCQTGCASILRILATRSLPAIVAGGGWVAGTIHDEMLCYVREEHADATLVELNRVWNALTLPSEQGGVRVRADFSRVQSWADK